MHNIPEFLLSEDDTLQVPLDALNNYEEYFKSLGFDRTDFDSNGWDIDFCVYFEKGGIKLCLSGNVWYENVLTLTKEGM